MSVSPSWKDISLMAEDVIRKSPASFNHLRDKGRLYDAQEATSILWKGGALGHHELSEEIISTDGVFSEEGKICLRLFQIYVTI